MNKIAVLLGMSLSISAHAWQPIKDTDYLVMHGSDGSTRTMLFAELETEIETDRPLLFEWCNHKSNIAGSMLADRGRFTQDELTDQMEPIKRKMKHHMWLELLRINAEIHRYDSHGNFQMEQTFESGNALILKEYQQCITRGF